MNRLFLIAATALFGTVAQATEVSPGAPIIFTPLVVAGADIDVQHQIAAENTMTVALITRGDTSAILRMRLVDGDKFSFALPGHPDALLHFERVGDQLTVSRRVISFEEVAWAD